jgi:hypothetical protein
VGLSRPAGRLEVSNPDRDTSYWVPTPDGNGVTLGTLQQRLKFHPLVPEVRAEWDLSREPTRPALLTVGAAYARLKPIYTVDLYFPSDPPVTTPLDTRLDGRLSAAYAQWTQRVDDRLSLAAQLRQQRLKMTRTVEYLGGGAVSDRSAQTRWLPSLLVNYRADDRTLLRLFYNRQAQEQELTPIAFRPVETFLTTEPLVMTKGSPDQTTTVELDAERYLASNGFLKLFAFRTTARGVDLGDLPTMPRVVRTGVGVRYEQRLSQNLYGQVGFLTNRTTNRTEFAPFDGGTAPYHPPSLAGLSLNYIDRTGLKVGLQLNYTGPFYQDTGVIAATDRPRFPERMYVDLTLAKEPTVDREYFLKVANLFDSRAIQFNDFPTGGRRIQAGVTWRY